MSSRPELAGTPKWRMRAKSELRSMKLAVSALPLFESLRGLVNELQRSKSKMALISNGHAREFTSEDHGSSHLGCFINAMDAIRSGNEMVLNQDALLIKPPDGFLDNISTKGIMDGADSVAKIERAIANADAWIGGKADQIATDMQILGRCGLSNDFFEDAIGRRPYRGLTTELNPTQRKKVIKAIKQRLMEIAGASALITKITLASAILTPDEHMALSELEALGVDDVRRFVKHDNLSKVARNGSWMGAMRVKLSIACPDAVIALREQWEGKETRWQALIADGEEAPAAPQHPKRSEAEEAEHLKQEFPNLHKRMMKPTPQEQGLRRRKNLAKRMRRSGIGFQEIHDAILIESGVQRAGCVPEEARSKKLKRKQMPQSAPSEMEEEGERRPSRNETMDKDDFIASVRLSAETERAIREYGLNPEDVVLSLFKGFNLGAKSSAIGGAHYRGDTIRGNIRRALGRRYRRVPGTPPHPDDILRFLKSQDLLNDFGSSASTKTKDDAMSLNTAPEGAVGQDIMRTINAALISLRR